MSKNKKKIRREKLQAQVNENKKEKMTMIQLWHHISNNMLIICIVSSLLTIVGAGGVYIYKQIQNGIDNLNFNVVNLVSADLDAYIICNTKSKMSEYWQEKAVLDIHNAIRDKSFALLKQRSTLGKHLSYQSYNTTAQFICWNNQLLTAGMDLCQAPLKKPAILKKQRDEILAQLIKDKERHQHIPQILKDYGDFVGSILFFRSSKFEQSYPAPRCDWETSSNR